MKKKGGVARAVEPIPPDELAAMPTYALLARLKRLRWCEERRESSDLSDDEIQSAEGKILFKDSEVWRQAYTELKTVLAEREHISRDRSRK